MEPCASTVISRPTWRPDGRCWCACSCCWAGAGRGRGRGRSGLARDYVDWARISAATTPTCTSTAACWRPGTAGAEAGGTPRRPPTSPPPELVALERQLDRLTGLERRALVLRFASGLSEQQVARCSTRPPPRCRGWPGRSRGSTSRQSRSRAVNEPEREGSRRSSVTRWLRGHVAATAGGVPGPCRARADAVAAAGRAVRRPAWPSLLVSRPPGSGPVRTATPRPGRSRSSPWSRTRRTSPGGRTGALHLANVTVEVPPSGRPIDHLAQINGGAVYGDDTGAVAFVGDDGKVTRIGTKAVDAPLVASDESGWVAWVDPRDESPRLVVYDLTAREVLVARCRAPAPAGTAAEAATTRSRSTGTRSTTPPRTVSTRGRFRRVRPNGSSRPGCWRCGRDTGVAGGPDDHLDGAAVLQPQLRPPRSGAQISPDGDAGADARVPRPARRSARGVCTSTTPGRASRCGPA